LLEVSHDNQSLTELGISRGETLIIEKSSEAYSSATPIETKPLNDNQPIVVCRSMPDDNSCLFNAISH
jgi:hypothetical protein